MGAFSCKVNVSSAIEAEMWAVIESVQIARLKGWLQLWLETDSLLIGGSLLQIAQSCSLASTSSLG